MNIRFAIVALAAVFPLSAQTQVDLASQGKSADFSGFGTTKPMKTGTQVPASCTLGEFFFLVGALPGNNLYACTNTNVWSQMAGLPQVSGQTGNVLATDGLGVQWTALTGDLQGPATGLRVTGLQNRAVGNLTPVDGQVLQWNGTTMQWEPHGITGSGGVTVKSNAVTVGQETTLNFQPGFGVLQSLLDAGSQISIQQSVDSAIVETRANLQAAGSLSCNSSATSGNQYQCGLNPSLSAYQAGIVVYWQPDVSPTAAATLNIDTLGAKPVLLRDGSNPETVDLIAGETYPIWYDGAAFRLMTVPVLGPRSAAPRPTCTAVERGRLWHVPGAAGVADTLALCAKDATDAYAWRGLY